MLKVYRFLVIYIFVMYYIHGVFGSSLLIESTDSDTFNFAHSLNFMDTKMSRRVKLLNLRKLKILDLQCTFIKFIVVLQYLTRLHVTGVCKCHSDHCTKVCTGN